MYRLQDSCLRRSLTISFQICIDLSPELVRQKMARCGNMGEEVRTVPGVDDCPVFHEVSLFVSQELSSRYAPLKGDAVWLNVHLFSES